MEEHLRQFHDLTPADFEQRDILFLRLDPDRWWPLAKRLAETKKHHFSHLKEAGVIFWFPPPTAQPQPPQHVLLLLLLHYVFEVNFYSSWFAMQLHALNQLGDDFVLSILGDQRLCSIDDWHLPILQQYHLKLSQPDQCVFEPHVMSEAVHWHKAAAIFFDIIRAHPAFHEVAFWEKCYTVGVWRDRYFINFNLMDNILSERSWQDYHFREEVWNEIFSAYSSQAHLEQLIIDNFSSKQIDLTILKTIQTI